MKLLRMDSSARRNFHAANQKTGELGEFSRAAAIAQIQEAAVEQTAAAELQ